MAIEEVKDETNLDGVESEEALNEEETPAEESPAPDPVADRLKAFEAQLDRQRQENEALRESVRLQSRLLEQQGQRQQPSTLSPELQELKKAIDPLLGEGIQSSMQPIIGTVSQLYEQNDAVSFQLQLQRENPELLTEENFDKISQVVDSVRQRAVQSNNTWLSRKDAYLYAKGAGMIKPLVKKAVGASKAESQRLKQVAAAQGTVGQPSQKIDSRALAEVDKIKAKASAGILLTDAERAKWRDSMGDGAF